MKIQCVWLETMDECEIRLRRYTSSPGTPAAQECPGRFGYHNASSSPIGREAFPRENGYQGDSTGTHDHADPRWPAACECGYVFNEHDKRQVNRARLYRAPDGATYILANAPVGAMWDAPWYLEAGFAKVTTDGICLFVKTPGGDWGVDCPAKDGGFWDRTGTVPNVTASPSILLPTYHGWLRAGFLESC